MLSSPRPLDLYDTMEWRGYWFAVLAPQRHAIVEGSVDAHFVEVRLVASDNLDGLRESAQCYRRYGQGIPGLLAFLRGQLRGVEHRTKYGAGRLSLDGGSEKCFGDGHSLAMREGG